jgi:hypothetical protein
MSTVDEILCTEPPAFGAVDRVGVHPSALAPALAVVRS